MTEQTTNLPPVFGNINRNSDAPLYAQIQRDIEIGIATKRLKPGDMIAGEVELASTYGVSRVTVRNALREFVTEGLLYRVQGKGTFVSQPIIQRSEPHVTSFFYEMVENDRKPTAEVFSEICPPSNEVRTILMLEPGQPVIITKRIRYVDEEPIVYQVNITPQMVCPGLVTEDLTNQSFQYTLEVKYGIPIIRVEEELTSVMPDNEMADILHIPGGVPVLADKRVLYGLNDQVIGISSAFFRGDRYTFKVIRKLDHTIE